MEIDIETRKIYNIHKTLWKFIYQAKLGIRFGLFSSGIEVSATTVCIECECDNNNYCY